MKQTLELVDERKIEYARQFSEAVEVGECTVTNETEEGTLTFESLQATADKFHEEYPKPKRVSEMTIEIRAKHRLFEQLSQDEQNRIHKVMRESINKMTRNLFMVPRRVVPRTARTEIARLTERTRRELYGGRFTQDAPDSVRERWEQGGMQRLELMRATCMPSRSRIIDGLRSRVEGMTGTVGRY